MSNPVVLYVDDDEKSRRIMDVLLVKRLAYDHVTIFPDSEGFVEKTMALTPPPDIIFLDIHVAPLSGFEMLQHLRELPGFESKPIVALTASVTHDEIRSLEDAGFDGCLSKPIDIDTFEDVIQALLNGEKRWQIV